MAYHINQTYYGDIHYVWCSAFFGASNIPSPYRPNPPSSSPQEIYDRLMGDVESGDKHSTKIKQNRAGLRRGANFKHAKGEINEAQRLEIFDKVRLAPLADFKPLLYIISYPLVSSILKIVPVKHRANPLSEEFIIQRLPGSSLVLLTPEKTRIRKMSQVNEINSTFYAMRLLSHQIDLSQIEVAEDDQYPATEFTVEEQSRALEIIRDLHSEMETQFPKLDQEINEPVIAKLADRIDELATGELAAAGYDVNARHDIVQLAAKRNSYSVAAASKSRVRGRLDVSRDSHGLRLTPRQRKIQRLIAQGRSSAEIARLLHVSISTVRTARVELKLRMRNLPETSQESY